MILFRAHAIAAAAVWMTLGIIADDLVAQMGKKRIGTIHKHGTRTRTRGCFVVN